VKVHTSIGWLVCVAMALALAGACNRSSTMPDGSAPGDIRQGDESTAAAEADGGDAITAAQDAASDVAGDGAVVADSARGFDSGSLADASTTVCGFPVPNPASTGLPNPMAYDTSLAGTAFDQVTRLMWERLINGHATALSGCTLDERAGLLCPLRYATAYCSDNRLGGFSDWRLPTETELASLVDFTMQYPAIDQATFPETPWEPFWSSTRKGNGELDDAWYVSFVLGVPSTAFIDEPHRVRCVRTVQVSPARCYTSGARYRVVDAWVTDVATGLVWQQDGAPEDHNLAEAQAYCDSLGGGSRLPSVKELWSIVDLSKTLSTGPMIDRSVFGIPRGWYWTSSTNVGAYQSLWSVSFDDGSVGTTFPANSIGQTKCVR
jgi:hypothetical protein